MTGRSLRTLQTGDVWLRSNALAAQSKPKKMRKLLPFCIVAVVALATVGGGTALYRAKRVSASSASAGGNSVPGDIDSQHVLGSPKAPVTLEEFGDFQCPPCGRLSEPIDKLEEVYKPNLRIVFRNFPLPVHVHAREAALAAEAAALQGKFWQMHDVLYREQATWSNQADARSLFNTYAGLVGLDLDRFKRDMDSERLKDAIEKDQRRGASLGVKNTPTIFINNHMIDPQSLNPDALSEAVRAALKEKDTK